MPAQIPAAFLWLILAFSAGPEAAGQSLREGVEAFGRRDLAAARQTFLALLETPAEAPRARYYLGRIALLESKPAEAIQWLEPIALATPPTLDAAARLSRAYQDAGQIAKAQRMTERALLETPWDGALHYRLGRIDQQLGDAAGARREFAESVRLKSADRQAVELLLQCSQALSGGSDAGALRIRQELLDNTALDPDVLVALGLTFTSAGRHAESLEPFQAAARRDPAFFQAQYNAGLALLKLGRPADAAAYLEAARRLSPDVPEANSALALSYVMQARYADALPPLEAWRALQPDNVRALEMLGLAELRGGAPARAVPLLRDAVRLGHGDAKPYFLLMEALNATEQQNAALEVAANAARLFPNLPQAALAHAQQLARLGRYRDAGPLFARAAELAPDSVDALLGLAEAQQKQGDYAASLATYRRALAIDRNNLTACLGAARDLILTQDFRAARTLLESALAAHPEHPALHYELSRVYARLGETALAAEQTHIFQELRARESKSP